MQTVRSLDNETSLHCLIRAARGKEEVQTVGLHRRRDTADMPATPLRQATQRGADRDTFSVMKPSSVDRYRFFQPANADLRLGKVAPRPRCCLCKHERETVGKEERDREQEGARCALERNQSALTP